MTTAEHLEWDSEFFGLPIARIECVRQPAAALRAQLGALKAQGYRLVYWLSPSLDLPTDLELSELGGVLVDWRTTYFRSCVDPSNEQIATHSGVEMFKGRSATHALRSLALQAGSHSRFCTDPRIGREKFEALYTRWIDSSVSGDLADAVLVIRKRGLEVAMVTVQCRERCGKIGLFAVDSSQRLQGLGAGLMHGALDYFRSRDCESAEVVTQGENRAACRLYEHCGYSVRRVERVYHFWL